MANKPGKNKPCYCDSGKKYKKCCLVKDSRMSLTDSTQKQKSCYECGKIIDVSWMSYIGIPESDRSKKQVYLCSICYREMRCRTCGEYIGVKDYSIYKCSCCEKVIIECVDCVMTRVKSERNIPAGQKIKIKGLSRRSQKMIMASMVEGTILIKV